MKINLAESIYNKRLIYGLILFVALVSIVAFLNYQMDDEIYIGPFDYKECHKNASFENGVLTVDETTGLKKGDVMAEIPAMHVDAGTYTLDMDHQSEYDFEAVIYDGEAEIDRVTLPASDLNTRYTFTSEKNLYNLKIDFIYNGKGYDTVKRTVIYSEGRAFYSDTLFFALIIILIATGITAMMIKLHFFELPTDMKLYYGIMILFALYINYPFLRPYVPYGGDIGYHVARTEGIYNGLLQGQFPVGIYTDVMHGRGMISAMYPHMFFVIPALLRLAHVSMEAAFRIFYMGMNLATCVTSYHAGKILSGNNKKWSLLTMILYCILPYRITTMTWRYAYGETIAFIFMPLVIAGLYEIILGDRRKWYVLVLGMSGLIECHLLSAIQGAMLCFILGSVFVGTLITEHRIIQTIFAAIVTLLVNIWFIAPFLYYYRSDILTTYLGTGDMAFISYFWADMLQFIPNSTGGDQMHHKMGIIGIGIIILGLAASYLLFVKKNYGKRERFSATMLIIAAIFIFAASKDFPWKTLEKFDGLYRTLSKFQFSGRFYMLGEGLILLAGIMILSDAGAFRYRKPVVILTVTVTLVQSFLVADTFSNLTKSMFIDSRAVRYTANISDAMEYDFYTPEAYDDETFIKNVFSPEAVIEGYKHDGINTWFSYTSDEETYVDIPLTYYLGYSAETLPTGESLQVLQGDIGNIRITLPVTAESKAVFLAYEGYPYQNMMTVISLLSFIFLLSIILHDKGLIRWKR